MKYFLIAGERSGDVYGAKLIAALLKKDPMAQIVCYGGDEMKAAGGELLSHYKESAFMGFYEVLTKLRVIKKTSPLKTLRLCNSASTKIVQNPKNPEPPVSKIRASEMFLR